MKAVIYEDPKGYGFRVCFFFGGEGGENNLLKI